VNASDFPIWSLASFDRVGGQKGRVSLSSPVIRLVLSYHHHSTPSFRRRVGLSAIFCLWERDLLTCWWKLRNSILAVLRNLTGTCFHTSCIRTVLHDASEFLSFCHQRHTRRTLRRAFKVEPSHTVARYILRLDQSWQTVHFRDVIFYGLQGLYSWRHLFIPRFTTHLRAKTPVYPSIYHTFESSLGFGRLFVTKRNHYYPPL
jgi:hypothetical protein